MAAVGGRERLRGASTGSHPRLPLRGGLSELLVVSSEEPGGSPLPSCTHVFAWCARGQAPQGRCGSPAGKAGALGSGKDLLCVKPPKPPSLAVHKVKLSPTWGQSQQCPWQHGGVTLPADGSVLVDLPQAPVLSERPSLLPHIRSRPGWAHSRVRSSHRRNYYGRWVSLLLTIFLHRIFG